MAVHYYRYWLAGSPTGFAHGLKMHFGPEAYRLMFNAGINLSTATDATVLPYADHYYEYDSSRRVTKEISAVCSSCTGGGTTSDLFSYTPNPRSPTPGYNVWAMKTVQTLPDSSQIIVYTNYIGLPMLYVVVDPTATNKWATFYRYNASGQVIWQAMPSAVNGYDDSNNDLLNYNSGTGLYQYLNNSTGLIYVTDYYTSGSGQPVGYIADNQVQQGQSGTPVKVRSFTYSSNTAGGITVNPIASTIDYPTSSSTPTITTSYAYTYFTGKNLVQTLTTTLPVVGSGQNGSGSPYTTVETFDSSGNLTSVTDERGIVNNYTYSALGLVTTQVLNYQFGVTRPGVNVTTTFTYDSQGRITQTLGPTHSVDLSGTATSVEKATYYVYIQSVQPGSGTWAVDQTWVGSGYLAGNAGEVL